MSPEFRAGERAHDPELICTECLGPAEGNASWTDGSGEICDSCVTADQAIIAQDRVELEQEFHALFA